MLKAALQKSCGYSYSPQDEQSEKWLVSGELGRLLSRKGSSDDSNNVAGVHEPIKVEVRYKEDTGSIENQLLRMFGRGTLPEIDDQGEG